MYVFYVPCVCYVFLACSVCSIHILCALCLVCVPHMGMLYDFMCMLSYDPTEPVNMWMQTSEDFMIRSSLMWREVLSALQTGTS